MPVTAYNRVWDDKCPACKQAIHCPAHPEQPVGMAAEKERQEIIKLIEGEVDFQHISQWSKALHYVVEIIQRRSKQAGF